MRADGSVLGRGRVLPALHSGMDAVLDRGGMEGKARDARGRNQMTYDQGEVIIYALLGILCQLTIIVGILLAWRRK